MSARAYSVGWYLVININTKNPRFASIFKQKLDKMIKLSSFFPKGDVFMIKLEKLDVEDLEKNGFIVIENIEEWENQYKENPETAFEAEELFDLFFPFDI